MARRKVSIICDSVNPSPGSNGAAPDRAADHFYRRQNVVCAVDRRQSELDRPFAARRDGAVEKSRNAA